MARQCTNLRARVFGQNLVILRPILDLNRGGFSGINRRSLEVDYIDRDSQVNRPPRADKISATHT